MPQSGLAFLSLRLVVGGVLEPDDTAADAIAAGANFDRTPAGMVDPDPGQRCGLRLGLRICRRQKRRSCQQDDAGSATGDLDKA